VITGREIVGLALAMVGILLVQVRGRKSTLGAEAPG
jgi:hypothetical protein